MAKWLVLGTILLAMIGCASKQVDQSEPPSASSELSSPAEKLRDQLSSGAFHTDAALESIAFAMDSVRVLIKTTSTPEHKSAAEELVEIIHHCGERLADYAEEPPSLNEVQSEFDAQDEARLKAIETINDCLHDLNEAGGILDSIIETSTGQIASTASELKEFLVRAIDDLMGAIKAYGGEVEFE